MISNQKHPACVITGYNYTRNGWKKGLELIFGKPPFRCLGHTRLVALSVVLNEGKQCSMALYCIYCTSGASRGVEDECIHAVVVSHI